MFTTEVPQKLHVGCVMLYPSLTLRDHFALCVSGDILLTTNESPSDMILVRFSSNGSPHHRSDRLPIQWLRINAGSLLHSAISTAAVCGLVVKEIAKVSTVVITIANTDIETDTEVDDHIAFAFVECALAVVSGMKR